MSGAERGFKRLIISLSISASVRVKCQVHCSAVFVWGSSHPLPPLFLCARQACGGCSHFVYKDMHLALPTKQGSGCAWVSGVCAIALGDEGASILT